MKIFVTGGTGFIGSHIVAKAVQAGHEPTLLVRSAEKLKRALAPHGIDAVDHVVGDVTDPRAIEEAMEGCEAVVHTAAMVSMRRSDAERVHATNVGGTTAVLDLAIAQGLDPIIHMSSVSAVFPPEGDVLRAEDRVSEPTSAYGRSKAGAERVARDRQEKGSPIVIFYPGGVVGPNEPDTSDMVEALQKLFAKGIFPLPVSGGVTNIDVRDLASGVVAALEPGRGPRRYMAGGRFLTWSEWIDTLNAASGRQLKTRRLPTGLLRVVGKLGDWSSRVLSIEPLLTGEHVYYMTHMVDTDDSRFLEELGVRYRPTSETMRDLVVWLVEDGRIDRSLVPGL
jgi:dihydroflavonol-4-reductase